jgi:DNA-binding MarR family transcriptional regulator
MQRDGTSDCAALVMETVPVVMRSIRAEMHRRRAPGISVPQFRALRFIGCCEGASLSQVSKHLSTSISSSSRLIEGLVEREYVARRTAGTDRRRVNLALTASGEEVLESMHREALCFLTETMARLSRKQIGVVTEAMKALQLAFGPAQPLGAREKTE